MSDVSYTAATWQPIIAQMLGEPAFARIAMLGGLPFVMEWGLIESDWNPCAIGSPAQTGPDGFPREIGLGQLYNPDDFTREGVEPAPFRAYCTVNSPDETRALAAQYLQAATAHDAQTMHVIAQKLQSRARDLTAQEMDAQVRYTLLQPIAHDMTIADGSVAKFALSWSRPDYWKLVKAPHALPGILSQGMPAVVAKLGRAPRSWAEFRSVLGMDKNDQWNRALNACEQCGNATVMAVS